MNHEQEKAIGPILRPIMRALEMSRGSEDTSILSIFKKKDAIAFVRAFNNAHVDENNGKLI